MILRIFMIYIRTNIYIPQNGYINGILVLTFILGGIKKCTLCFFFTGLRTGKYDQIMRWWISGLGQGLLNS